MTPRMADTVNRWIKRIARHYAPGVIIKNQQWKDMAKPLEICKNCLYYRDWNDHGDPCPESKKYDDHCEYFSYDPTTEDKNDD